ncbi:MAG: hypothetical protein GXY33_18940 [Phycisphaerae bacterium]|nr:hypothetical protein [Phycisphaerae bacterium]
MPTEKVEYEVEKLPRVVCDRHPEWVELYNAAWQMGFANVEYVARPGWKPQLTCMPGMMRLWQWDSCFMTLFARYSNGQLPGMNNLDNLYRLQRSDGFMSMAYDLGNEQPAFGERINPPLMAWVEWEYYRATGDDSRFEQALPRLVRFFDWVKANRRRCSGLYWFEDSGSSGMDNSPRSGYLAQDLRGSDVCFIDLAAQQALAAAHLGKMARHLGQFETAERFEREHSELAALIEERHWCERAGIYFDLFGRERATSRHNFVNHKTLAAFWPIVAGVAREDRVGRLIEHLLDPREFWRPHPLPTLSADDPNYDPLGGYWLGGVWAPTNYMVAAGLKRHGKHEVARQIAVRHLEAMTAVMGEETFASIWECYSPEYTRPATNGYGVLCRPCFVGWTGLGPIAMLIEHVLGFEFEAADNVVRWVIGTPGRHGIEHVRFNGRTVSLVCDGPDPSSGRTKVVVRASDEINVAVSLLGRFIEHKATLPAGEHELHV